MKNPKLPPKPIRRRALKEKARATARPQRAGDQLPQPANEAARRAYFQFLDEALCPDGFWRTGVKPKLNSNPFEIIS